MEKITTILWDVDGTLLDFIYSQRISMKKCFETIGKKITDEMLKRYSQINDSYWKRLELGEVTKEELLLGRFTTFFEEYDIRDVDAAAFAREYQDNLGRLYCLNRGALEVCRRLKGRVKQYVVTNGVTATQESKLALSGLSCMMDGCFISEAVGAPKPQKAFFDYCLSHIEEKDKKKIMIVGDSLSSDIKGGAGAGIRTCWYHPEDGNHSEDRNHPVVKKNADIKPDHEISDLWQILDLL